MAVFEISKVLRKFKNLIIIIKVIKMKTDKKIEKLQNLIERITTKESAYRARHLIRVLENALNSGNLEIDILRKSDGVVRGIAQTLDYLTGKTKIFDEDYGGWGLYKPVTEGVHPGEFALKFAVIGGNTKIEGRWGGWYADFYGKSEAIGNDVGYGARFYNESEASGIFAGRNAKFYDNSKASGKYAGHYAKFYDNSKASGKYAGHYAKFYTGRLWRALRRVRKIL